MIRPGTSEYRILHYWVRSKLGTPMKCGDTSRSRYHWSNISGKYYKNLDDWARLCPSCHFKKDLFREFCPSGHKIAGENLYIYDGNRYCRECKRQSWRNWKKKKIMNRLLQSSNGTGKEE